MILNLIPLLLTAAAGYFIYNKFIAERLDCPANNPNVKGLEKDEIKAAIKEGACGCETAMSQVDYRRSSKESDGKLDNRKRNGEQQ